MGRSAFSPSGEIRSGNAPDVPFGNSPCDTTVLPVAAAATVTNIPCQATSIPEPPTPLRVVTNAVTLLAESLISACHAQPDCHCLIDLIEQNTLLDQGNELLANDANPSDTLIAASFGEHLSASDGWPALAALRRHGLAVILLVAPSCRVADFGRLEKAVDAVLPLPATRPAVLLSLQCALNNHQHRHRLLAEVELLRTRQEQAKWIGRAKEIIAANGRITEAEALRSLRREARNRRQPMHQLARRVVLANDVIPPFEHHAPAGPAAPLANKIQQRRPR